MHEIEGSEGRTLPPNEGRRGGGRGGGGERVACLLMLCKYGDFQEEMICIQNMQIIWKLRLNTKSKELDFVNLSLTVN